MKKSMMNLEDLLKNLSCLRNMQAKLSSVYLTDYAFTPNELNVLILLSNNPSMDTAKELSMYLGVSKGLICRSLDHLAALDMIRVEEDPADHRKQRLRLKKCSQPVIERIKQARNVIGEKLLQGICEEELQIVEGVFDKIRNNIQLLKEEEYE